MRVVSWAVLLNVQVNEIQNFCNTVTNCMYAKC